MPKHLQRMKNGTWRVRVAVPPRLVSIIGKANFTHPLGTKDEADAASRAMPIIADYEAKIAEAERELMPLAANEVSAASRRWFYLDDDPFFNYSLRGSPPAIQLVPVFGEHGELMGYRNRKEKDPPNIIVSMARIWSDSRSTNIDRKTWVGVISKLKRLSNHFEEFNPFHITADDLADYPSTLLSDGLKPGTVDDHLVYIKAVFAAIKDAGLIDTNPAENLTRRALVSRVNVKKIRVERDAELAEITQKIEQETDPVKIRLYRAEYALRHAEFAALLAPPNKRSEAIANRIRASVWYQEMHAKAIAITIMRTT
jgi:hypothetical protein